MAPYIGNKFTEQDSAKLVGGTKDHRSTAPLPRRPCCLFLPAAPLPPLNRLLVGNVNTSPRHFPCILQKDFEKRVDPNDRNAQALLDEMRQHIKKVSGGAFTAGPGLSGGGLRCSRDCLFVLAPPPGFQLCLSMQEAGGRTVPATAPFGRA